ncbi:MAG TPA: Na+/H+ antiporter NhaC family protein [Salinivirga sp.]|uniref:Na+/H+ antiporter NhaC family protein n=1 Tax=Salinivirga sp. TaxID=1970192 RepID=UPI002B482D50|nr:Na+/H+ antiporter NhaC family protein [Salinivirga sp.]HKK58455.1 Na+/H+ antiporter NhaC family protein [Salinivirga sp.]
MTRLFLTTLIFFFFANWVAGQCELNELKNKNKAEIEWPGFIIQEIPANLKVESKFAHDTISIKLPTGEWKKFVGSKGNYKVTFNSTGYYEVRLGPETYTTHVRVMPLWYSILPPLIAILFAMLFKEVLTALLIGLLSGTVAIAWYSGDSHFGTAFITGFFDIIDNRIIHTIADSGHASVIVFSLMIGAVVQIIRNNGGMHGLVQRLARKVSTQRKGMFFTWLMGVLIFFDDYANTLVVGNTVRPITDRLKISREKLAYIVDSTAAPVACLAFVTTWIGVELSYIQEGLNQLSTDISPYQLFLQSLPYRFYPFLALIFILFMIYQRRDFGPMYKAEIETGKLRFNDAEDQNSQEDKPKSSHWLNAIVPVGIIVFGTFAGLIVTGYDIAVWQTEDYSFIRKLSITIGNSDAFKALLWSSMTAVVAAFVMSVSQKLLTLRQTSDAIIDGFRSMLSAIVILILAWSLASITQELHTAQFLAGFLSALKSLPGLLPAITFVLGALVAFSTGSSWGTMAILYPLLMPVTWHIGEMAGMPLPEINLLLAQMVSGILAGAVLGDHCSPISDTTILSSLASNCDHISHVKTQMPYALTVGSVALFIGLVPLIWNVSPWITYPIGITVLYFVLKLFGKKVQ